MNIKIVLKKVDEVKENEIVFEPVGSRHTAVWWHCEADAKQGLRDEVWGLKCVKSTEKYGSFYPAVFKNDKLPKVRKAVERALANPYR